MLDVNIDSSWHKVIETEFSKPYFCKLIDFITNEYKTTSVCPAIEQIFTAFENTTFENTKVVLVGQDPYHGSNQANGLCFSVNEGVRIPPSLKNIFKELKADLGTQTQTNGNLNHWAKQGVLMLNATLTVRAQNPGSHQQHGWEIFTDAIIKTINDQKKNVVFILWGAYSQKKCAMIDRKKHFVIESAHPSPFSARKGFFGSKPFSKTNNYLTSCQIKSIDW